ncbi:MAG TPA: 30S ribosomal protein S13 [Candidatus Gracilibacteria bacterium]
MRIAGTVIPTEKRLIIALQYIYGIGPKRSQEVCEKTKLDQSIRVKDLTPDQEELLRKTLTEGGWLLESDLKRDISSNIKRLKDIGSYRGFRHARSLPVRGQRTKTNARTRKGRKKTVANKKKVTK